MEPILADIHYTLCMMRGIGLEKKSVSKVTSCDNVHTFPNVTIANGTMFFLFSSIPERVLGKEQAVPRPIVLKGWEGFDSRALGTDTFNALPRASGSDPTLN